MVTRCQDMGLTEFACAILYVPVVEVVENIDLKLSANPLNAIKSPIVL